MEYNFKTAVTAYQTNGDGTILRRIYDYLDTALHIESKRHISDDGEVTLIDETDPAKFIAYSMGAMMYKLSKTARYRFILDMEDLYWYSKHLREYGYAALTPENNFAILFDHYEEIRGLLDPDVFAQVLYFVAEFQEHRRDMAALYAMERKAIEHALTLVDVNRSEREMVTYINRVFHTEFRRLQMERDGVVRLRRGNESVYVAPRQTDPWRMVFGMDALKAGQERINAGLSASQAELVAQVTGIITEDYGKGPRYMVQNYKINENGNYALKNRYMAERLGLEESNLRKRLVGIRQKAK